MLIVLVPNVRFDVTLGTFRFVSWLIVSDMLDIAIPNVRFDVTLGTFRFINWLIVRDI